jgi:hypothetical protein
MMGDEQQQKDFHAAARAFHQTLQSLEKMTKQLKTLEDAVAETDREIKHLNTTIHDVDELLRDAANDLNIRMLTVDGVTYSRDAWTPGRYWAFSPINPYFVPAECEEPKPPAEPTE